MHLPEAACPPMARQMARQMDRFARRSGRGSQAEMAPTDRPGSPSALSSGHPHMELPARGRITSIDIVDGVGSITLTSGGEVRFGATACKGFEPVVGVAVQIEEVAPGPRGLRAKVIRLDDREGAYDTLLAARNKQHGLGSGRMSNEEAVATCRQLAVATVLLRDPLPTSHAELKRWTDALGLPRPGIAVALAPDLAFSLNGGISLTYPGRTTFPEDGLDASSAPPDLDLGQAFLGFGMGIPGVARQLRAVNGRAPDFWAPGGPLRALAKLLVALAPAATAVVLHRAGELLVPIDRFVAMHGDLEDPTCVPFAAWLDAAPSQRPRGACYGTFGMGALGLPDVFVPADHHDAYDRGRAHEAVMFACYTMVRENRELALGEVLRVPVRTRIGAFPLVPAPGPDAAVREYEVGEDGDHLGLTPRAPQDDRRAWRERRVAIAPAVYQSLFDHGLSALIPSDIIRDIAANQPEIPHRVEVRERHDGLGFLTVTNGFGRAPHAIVHRADCAHFEVGVWSSDHAFGLLRLVGMLADYARRSDAGGWQPGDTVATDLPLLGIGGFVLADGGPVDMGSGAEASVRLLLLIPLSPHEYATVRGHGLAWLASHPIDGTEWDAFPFPS